jgi:hypothetical protein
MQQQVSVYYDHAAAPPSGLLVVWQVDLARREGDLVDKLW